MKRTLCLLLSLLLLLSLCACTEPEVPDLDLFQPFDFYYRTAEVDFDSGSGPIRAETRDLGENGMSDEALIALYLGGPEDETLVSPFPAQTRLKSIQSGATLLRVVLSEEYAQLQGVDASIADACLAKTLLALGSFRRIRISSVDEKGAELRSVVLEEDDILLSDMQTDAGKLELRLYFADAEGRYLLSEKRTVRNLPMSELPKYVTEQLIKGPQTTGLHPVIPVGTLLLDINVENGVCAVDLSAEFLNNRSVLQLPEHLSLFALANTLTELDGIDTVQFYVEGRQDRSFGAFPLNRDYSAETRVVGPSHPELHELDCKLLLPIADTAELYELPLRVRSGSNAAAAESLLAALFAFAPQNGLDNPWYDQPLPQQVLLEDGVCTVDFAANPNPGDSGVIRAIALRSLHETLLGLDEVEAVRITVNGNPI